jgi:hypothetical protein
MYTILLNGETGGRKKKKHRISTKNYHLGQNLNTERSHCETAVVTMQWQHSDRKFIKRMKVAEGILPSTNRYEQVTVY